MSSGITPSEQLEPPRSKQPSRIGAYVVVVIAIAFVVAAAAFQEPIGHFIHLRAWDQGAPGRTVQQFVASAKRRDREAADRYLRISRATPIMKGGQWAGIRVPMGMLVSETWLDDILPPGEPEITRTEFIYLVDGAADVWTRGRSGVVKYRLRPFAGEWKITEIVELR
jgi:hypothetical protein